MDNGDIVDQFECYSYNKFVEDEAIDYKIFDTETSPDKSALRGLSHPNTDVFIICFSLVHPKSLENVEKVWVPEAKKYCPDASIILVGNNLDLRDEFQKNETEFKSKGYEIIPIEKGIEMQQKIGAKSYIEISSQKMININNVFDEAAKIVIHKYDGIDLPSYDDEYDSSNEYSSNDEEN